MEILDNFAEQTIKITSEALAEKDKIIKDLQAQINNCRCPRCECGQIKKFTGSQYGL